MDRRELLKMIALLTGGVVIGGDLFLSGCKSAAKSEAVFTPASIKLLNEVGETIIPATATPGAKAARVGDFMQVMVTDCYTAQQQKVFMNGIQQIDDDAEKMYKKSFLECTPAERHALLVSLEKEAKIYNQKRDADDNPKRTAMENKNSTVPWKDQQQFEPTPSHYYFMMKQLTLLGFFSSETGMTETLRYLPVPGKYDGNLSYAKGDKAWAE